VHLTVKAPRTTQKNEITIFNNIISLYKDANFFHCWKRRNDKNKDNVLLTIYEIICVENTPSKNTIL